MALFLCARFAITNDRSNVVNPPGGRYAFAFYDSISTFTSTSVTNELSAFSDTIYTSTFLDLYFIHLFCLLHADISLRTFELKWGYVQEADINALPNFFFYNSSGFSCSEALSVMNV